MNGTQCTAGQCLCHAGKMSVDLADHGEKVTYRQATGC